MVALVVKGLSNTDGEVAYSVRPSRRERRERDCHSYRQLERIMGIGMISYLAQDGVSSRRCPTDRLLDDRLGSSQVWSAW